MVKTTPMMSDSQSSLSTAAESTFSEALSFTQESLWLADKMTRQDGPAYNEPCAFKITGKLHIEMLKQALHWTVKRHEALRTIFLEKGDRLHAIIQDQFVEFVDTVDLRSLTPQAANERAREMVNDSYSRIFDLRIAPLLRVLIVQLPDDETVVALTIHHLVTDGWSNMLILDEISHHYSSLCISGTPADLPMPQISYPHYVQNLRQDFEQGAFDAKIKHWKEHLKAGPELLRLPLDHPRPPRQTFSGSSCLLSLPKIDLAALLDICRIECRSTEFTTLLAAYAVLLHRYTDQEEIAIGTTILNRTSDELLDIVGCFVNTIPLILPINKDMSFRELLANIERISHQMLNEGDTPYTKVLGSLDIEFDPSYNPIFQTMLTLLGERPKLDLGKDIRCKLYPVKRIAAKYEILMYVSEDEDQIEFEAEFNTDLFDASTIERMLRHYILLLTRLAEDIDAPISMVSFLSVDEERCILDTWNNTKCDYPASTIVDFFEKQAERTPNATAVDFEGQSLTYEKLNLLANQVARFLRKKQRTNASPFIGVYMERSLEMVVALLSIIKAGFAYVPIDPEYPVDRINFMIEDAESGLILTHEQYSKSLMQSKSEIVVISITQSFSEDGTNLQLTLTPDAPVYMIYTSGSTGRPKGVINRHVSLFNRLYWMQNEYHLTSDDRILQKTPFSFDVSVWEFFWPLMFGARIVIARPGGHRDPNYMKSLIRDQQVTTVHFVPSMLNAFFEEEDLASFCGSLRRVICSGEALPYTTVERFYATLTCSLHNLYGPTEAAIDVSYWPCSLDYPGKIVPIGKPIANVQLYIVDKHLHLQPIGVPGELCIGGVGLAIGYHHRDDLTLKAFVHDPFSHDAEARLYHTGDLARFLPDGQIQYLGRIDTQIKLRGLRIELEEIRATLINLPDIKDAAVVVRKTDASQMLVGYVVMDNFNLQFLKEQLRKQLPEFMIPQILVPIPAIPTTANGKMDQRALPDVLTYTQEEDQNTQPRSQEEKILTRIWSDVLGMDNPGIDANFFRHGGDSILSIRIVARLRESGYNIEVHDVFAQHTIRKLAEVMASHREEPIATIKKKTFLLVDPIDQARFDATIEDAWPLTILQAGMIYHTMLEEETSVYHDIFDYDIASEVHPAYIRETFRLIATQHPQLRSLFDLSSFSMPLQIISTHREIPVEIIDLCDCPQQQQNKIIQQWIADEKQRGFDIEHGPMLRVRVHVRSNQTMNLAISFHHTILDGWSISLVVEEFRNIYAGLLKQHSFQPVEEQILYSTYVKQEQQAIHSPEHAAFWLQKLKGFTETLFLPLNSSQPPLQRSMERLVPQYLVASLQTFASETSVPSKSVYLALHLYALGKVLGKKNIVSGLVTHGRPELPGSDALVGLFLNTIPFPFELQEENWSQFTKRVFESEQGFMAYRRFPLAEIQRLTGTDVWFDVAFNYTDFHLYRSTNNNEVRLISARYFEQTNIDVVVHIHHDYFTGTWRLIVNYNIAQNSTDLVEHYIDEYLAAAVDLVNTEALGNKDSTPPLTALEQQIVDIVSQAIGIEHLSVDDNYLELGLDSITAIRVVARIKKLSPGLTMKDVFAHTTVRGLAQQATNKIETRTNERSFVKPFELAGGASQDWPSGVIDAYPATSMQIHMVQKTDQDIAQAMYHDVFSYHLSALFDEPLLRSCLMQELNTHDTLRTAFSLENDVAPIQLVYENVQPHIEVFKLSELPDLLQRKIFNEWFEQEKQTGFNWAEPGLLRFAIHQWNSDVFTLTISFHHSIIDGWSLSLFIRNLVKRYTEKLNGADLLSLPAPKLKFCDYVRVELESRKSHEQQEFWRAKLHGHSRNSLPRIVSQNILARWSETKIVLDEGQQEKLSMLGTHLGIPVKHIMLAAHLRVVSHICKQADILTGVFASGRLEEDGSEEVLGLFLNFLPFRQQITNQTWRSFILEIFDNDRQSLPYRRYPLEYIEKDLGEKPLFETLFNYTRFKAYSDVAFDKHQCTLTGIQWFEHTAAPLLANVGHDPWQGRTVITLNADGRVLPQEIVELIGQLYDVVLTQLLDHVDTEVTQVSAAEANIVRAIARGSVIPTSTMKGNK